MTDTTASADRLREMLEGLEGKIHHQMVMPAFLRQIITLALEALSASPSPYGVEELVERAFKDGLAYGSNVEGADPETAWMQSRVRASLGRLALKNQESDRG